jgi:hypothetical protein
MRKLLPLAALVLAACSEGGVASWAPLATTATAEPSQNTAALTAPELGIETVGDLVGLLEQSASPQSYHFDTRSEFAAELELETVVLSGSVDNGDFQYTELTLDGALNVIYTGDTLWLNWEGDWVIPDDQTLPPHIFTYDSVVEAALNHLSDPGSIGPVEPGQTDGAATAGYRAEIPEISDSAPLGGSRTIDLWFTADGTLIRYVETTVVPGDVDYALAVYTEWEISQLDAAIEIEPPATDTVVVGS